VQGTLIQTNKQTKMDSNALPVLEGTNGSISPGISVSFFWDLSGDFLEDQLKSCGNMLKLKLTIS
jgi:hypothetical protein